MTLVVVNGYYFFSQVFTCILFNSSGFALFFQELLHPLGESEFLPGRVLQKLLDIGFCGGKWSEKVCYDIGEVVFGFDDINNNMVSMELFSF